MLMYYIMFRMLFYVLNKKRKWWENKTFRTRRVGSYALSSDRFCRAPADSRSVSCCTNTRITRLRRRRRSAKISTRSRYLRDSWQTFIRTRTYCYSKNIITLCPHQKLLVFNVKKNRIVFYRTSYRYKVTCFYFFKPSIVLINSEKKKRI